MKHKPGLMAAMIGLAATGGAAASGAASLNKSVNSSGYVASPAPTQRTDGKQTNQFSNQEKINFKERYTSPRKLFFNDGIDPKTYRMHHVKRGTHKRTNV